MTGSRIKRLLCAVAFGALVVPAMAQWVDPKPPVLQPDDYPPEATDDPPDPPKAAPKPATGTPQTLAPVDQSSEPPPSAPTYVPSKVDRGPVQVESLGSAEGPPVGTLDATNGGFGDHLWSGSDRAQMEALLAKSPLVSGDPVLRSLVRRAVLTRAPAPPGQAPKAFITVRIERLLDAGLVSEAGELAAQANVPNDDAFARLQAEAVLLANRAADACGPATAARQTGADLFWMQLRAYCAAVTGDSATAELTRQVMKAQGMNDPAYDTLVQSVLTKKPLAPGAIANPSALHIFLLQQAGLPITEPIARKLGTPENELVLRDIRNSPRARFEAAERVVATGAASASALIKIADAQNLPLGKVAAAAGEAPNLPFFMGQVLLRRAAAIEPRPEAKADLAVLALSLGDKYKLARLAAALQADVILSIKPSGQHTYARTFARALLLAGKPDGAAAWTDGDPVMKAMVAVASNRADRLNAVQPDLAAWTLALAHPDPAAPADPDRALKLLILGVANALHVPLPPDAAGVIPAGRIDDRDLAASVRAPDRRGEAVLRITDTVRRTGLATMPPELTLGLVKALTDIGEATSAHALAVEALAEYEPASPLGQQAAAQ